MAAAAAGVLLWGIGSRAAQDARATVQGRVTDALERPPFDAWLRELRDEARERGIPDRVLNEALDGLEPIERVIENDREQPELAPGFDRYYSVRVTAAVIRQGQQHARTYRTWLGRATEAYGVPAPYLVAIWGIETRYGRVTGSTPVFQALATLAWEPRRADFFRGELFDALTMVSRGHIDARSMTGSWAGAMGQPQFMPSSYLKYAEDFDRDGRRDIWRSTADALASIANYLAEWGWDDERTWGREVRITPEVRERLGEATTRRTEGCFAMRNMTERLPLGDWQRLGIRRADGTALPTIDVMAGLVDTDTRSFLVYPNYDALLRYNCAHYYALTVALLADQLQ